MRKILFILNPVAGARKLKITPEIIRSHFIDSDIEIICEYTKFAGHASQLSLDYIEQGATDIVAVGGDGSVRDVAKTLVYTDVRLGIIPTGSGNALARHLGIPCHSEESIDIIRAGTNIKMDVGKMNEEYFFANSGLGIDAQIIHQYDKIPQRGFLTYFLLAIKVFFSYKPNKVKVHTPNQEAFEIKPELFMVSVSNQFGYGVKISPEASITDGYFNLFISPKLNLFHSAMTAFKALMGKSYNHHKIRRELITECSVEFPDNRKIQFDGEPFTVKERIDFKIIASGLSVILPEKKLLNI